MFYHQQVARVRVFADIQNFALRAHCVHGIPHVGHLVMCSADLAATLSDNGGHHCRMEWPINTFKSVPYASHGCTCNLPIPRSTP